jgi:hypothetical protein
MRDVESISAPGWEISIYLHLPSKALQNETYKPRERYEIAALKKIGLSNK